LEKIKLNNLIEKEKIQTEEHKFKLQKVVNYIMEVTENKSFNDDVDKIISKLQLYLQQNNQEKENLKQANIKIQIRADNLKEKLGEMLGDQYTAGLLEKTINLEKEIVNLKLKLEEAQKTSLENSKK